MNSNINRVVAMKIRKNNSLLNDFEKHSQAVAFLMNDIICWGVDSVYDKTQFTEDEGKKHYHPINLIDIRKERYEKTDKSVSYNQFNNMLKLMFNYFVKSKQGRGSVSVILGKPRTNDMNVDHKKVEDFLNEFNREKDGNVIKEINNSSILYKVSNKLKDMGFRKGGVYDMRLPSHEKYSVVENVHRMITSWIECNKSAKQEYKQEDLEIDNAISKVDNKVKKELENFFNFCIQHNIVKHFDERVHHYLRDCIIPALKSGKENIDDHFYIFRETEKRSYSLNEDFFNYLKNHPVLWEKEDTLLTNIHILEKMIRHDSHQEYAFYPFIKTIEDANKRSQYLLGDNYTKFNLLYDGDKCPNEKLLRQIKKDQVEQIEYVDGRKVDNLQLSFAPGTEKTQHDCGVYISEQYYNGSYNPSKYFKNLEIFKLDHNTKNAYLFKFDKKGQKIKAYVKEPSIVYREGELYIRFNMTIDRGQSYELSKDILALYSTALPDAKTKKSSPKESNKNEERRQRLKDHKLRVLGIDLGQRSPFSWAVAEFTAPNSEISKIVNTGSWSSTTNDNKYFDLLNDMKNCSKIIGITKSITKGKNASFNKSIINTIKNAQNFYAGMVGGIKSHKNIYESFININPEKAYDECRKFCENNDFDLLKIKTQKAYLGNIIHRYVNTLFKKTKNDNKYHLTNNDIDSKLDCAFTFLRCIEQKKRLCRQLSYLGTDNNRDIVELKKINKYYNGYKDNLLKTLASKVAQVALENKCNIIAMEDLKHKKLNKRRENFLAAFWSPQRIKDAIRNAAEWYNIQTGEVSESQTSQVHFETLSFGYRDKDKLYYISDKNKIESVDADINAAKNVANNFVTRHRSTYSVNLDIIRSVGKKKNKKTTDNTGEVILGKRLKGFLTAEFGCINNAIEFFKKEKFNNSKYAYKNKGRWITDEKKKLFVNGIKKKIEGDK